MASSGGFVSSGFIFGDAPYKWEEKEYFNLIIEARKKLNKSAFNVDECLKFINRRDKKASSECSAAW